MADIELVIKIPKETYEYLKRYGGDGGIIDKAVLNGTPLPKGHGRLKDTDAICKDIISALGIRDENYLLEAEKAIYKRIKNALTVIEADKGYEDEVITRGNCMMCGKELTEGLLFCKECEAKIMQGRGEKKPCNLKPTDKYFQYSCCPYYREGFCGRGEYDLKCAWESEEGKCTYYQDEAESEKA